MRRHLWMVTVIVAGLAAAWWVRPGGAAPAAALKTIDVTLPAAYGELRGVDRGSLYFEALDGTIHIVHLSLDGQVDQDTIRIKRP